MKLTLCLMLLIFIWPSHLISDGLEPHEQVIVEKAGEELKSAGNNAILGSSLMVASSVLSVAVAGTDTEPHTYYVIAGIGLTGFILANFVAPYKIHSAGRRLEDLGTATVRF